MTEKTKYITASIDILTKRDELNADELAVLCNLKKFMHQNQPTFTIGEYYSYNTMDNVLHILKITAVRGDKVDFTFLNTKSGSLVNMDNVKLDKRYIQPATAEQIATFKRAEQFAKYGRKLDEFRVGDITTSGVVSKVGGDWITTRKANRSTLCAKGSIDLIRTAEELQEEAK